MTGVGDYEREDVALLVSLGVDVAGVARELGLSPLRARVVVRAVRARLDATPSADLLPLPMPTQEDIVRQTEHARRDHAVPLGPNATRTATEKRCPGCEQWLPLGRFSQRVQQRASGESVLTYRSRCRACEAVARAERHRRRAT